MIDNKYWIWFQSCVGEGAQINKYLDEFTSVKELYNATQYPFRLTHAQLEKLMNKDLDAAENIIKKCKERGYKIISFDDEDYPELFRFLSNPPAVIYMKGDFDFNCEPMVSMVGARKASKYSLNVATRLAYSLASGGMSVVSGGALGVDSASHKGALLAGGKTILVLGCGLGTRYLMENATLREKISQNGALISEFPPDRTANKSTFPLRNRLIASLGLGTIVIEANIRSGSLITAKCARECGKDVFAVPGGIYNSSFEGVNRLLKDGAKAVFGVEDILEEYESMYPEKINLKKALYYDINVQEKNYEELPETHIDAVDNEIKLDFDKKKQFPDLSPKARLVYDCLEFGEAHVNEIASKTGLSLNEVLSHLTTLELIEAVEALPGRKYKQK